MLEPSFGDLVKRLLPILIAIVLAILAFVSAYGVNAAVRVAIGLPEGAVLEEIPGGDEAPSTPKPKDSSVAAVAPVTPSGPRVQSRKEYIDAILARNIFDHTAIGQSATEDVSGIALTDLNVTLIATIVAEPAELSFALIAQEGPNAVTMSYGIGDNLADDAVIARIEPRRVTLRKSDGTEEVLTMDRQEEPGHPQVADAKPPTEGALEGITELGENRYAVDRSLIDKYLTDMAALSSWARAIPHRGPDGEIDGYRLSGIRRSSPLSQLGVRNGDVIHGVNGTSLSSLTDAMGAFQSLQSQSSFSFDVTRRGQKQTMEYQIR